MHQCKIHHLNKQYCLLICCPQIPRVGGPAAQSVHTPGHPLRWPSAAPYLVPLELIPSSFCAERYPRLPRTLGMVLVLFLAAVLSIAQAAPYARAFLLNAVTP